jgi:hypothetical protein
MKKRSLVALVMGWSPAFIERYWFADQDRSQVQAELEHPLRVLMLLDERKSILFVQRIPESSKLALTFGVVVTEGYEQAAKCMASPRAILRMAKVPPRGSSLAS